MKELRSKLNKLPLVFFYLGLTIELLLVVIDKSAIPPLPEGHIYRVTFALFAIAVFFTKYTKKEWLVLVVFTIFTFVMYRITGENVALRAVVFIAAMRCVSLKPMMKYVFWLILSGTLIIMMLSFFDIGRGIKSTEIYRDEVLETRYSFGMGHPNSFHFMVLLLLVLFLYIYIEKLNMQSLVLLFIGHFGLFLLTDSKAGFASGTLVIIGAVIMKRYDKLKNASWVYWVGMLVFLFCIGVSVWAATVPADAWHNPVINQLDRLFTGRIKTLYWGNQLHAGTIQTWSLFADKGNFIYEYQFDMGWVRLFYWFGIIPGLVFCALHLILLNECRKQKDYMGLVVITACSVYTIVEPQMVSLILARNCLLFLFGIYWGRMLYLDGKEEIFWWQMRKETLNEQAK